LTDYLPGNEKALLLSIAEGDETAFSQLFYSYYPRLFSFLNKLSRQSDNIDEAIQETFIRVWLSRDQLPGVENFQAWLFTIASREAIALMRKNLLTEKSSGIYQSRQDAQHPETPAEIIQAGEIKKLAAMAIAQMPPARRRIYRMSREQGLKPAEIAAQLGLSVNTVKNTLVSALHDIRKYLSQHGH